MAAPHLSIVVTSRNDDHGGDGLGRIQLCVSSLLEQLERHRLSSELIVVEWNPPSDRPRLAEAIRWPKSPGPCRVRVIEVPCEMHNRIEHSKQLPLFQMIGKNVGIRRARGEFVLATNMDILFSEEILRYLSAGRLKRGRMYRIDRHDVPEEVPLDLSVSDRLQWCRDRVIRVHCAGETIECDSSSSARGLSSRGCGGIRRRLENIRRHRRSMLHTNACGDFTLMAAEHWNAVRGYFEFEGYSFRLDALLCYAAHFAGARETMLNEPMRIYHMEHAPGSGWTPGSGGKQLNERLEKAKIPQVSFEDKDRWISQMRARREPVLLSSESWGLADDELEEIVVV